MNITMHSKIFKHIDNYKLKNIKVELFSIYELMERYIDIDEEPFIYTIGPKSTHIYLNIISIIYVYENENIDYDTVEDIEILYKKAKRTYKIKKLIS